MKKKILIITAVGVAGFLAWHYFIKKKAAK